MMLTLLLMIDLDSDINDVNLEFYLDGTDFDRDYHSHDDDDGFD